MDKTIFEILFFFYKHHDVFPKNNFLKTHFSITQKKISKKYLSKTKHNQTNKIIEKKRKNNERTEIINSDDCMNV